MSVLLTGGAGYIGSHIAVELLSQGKDVVIFDNFSNASKNVIEIIEKISGKNVKLYEGDIRSSHDLEEVFDNEEIEAVIHLAGLKAVGESVAKPLEYYDNNISGTLVLLDVMKKYDVKNIIFSSSATVYAANNGKPFSENDEKGRPTNPYGWSKWFIEQILEDLHTCDNSWNIVIFRYFNPIGAHSSGMIGEDPKGIPNNLLPYVNKVAVGLLPKLMIFGDDYNTKDGTGVRDYIHVVDLAKGHTLGLDVLRQNKGVSIYNLGTGNGSSVLDIVNTFEKVTGVKINYEIGPRRDGDIDTSICDASKANNELGWTAQFDLAKAIEDGWNWQSNNPNGYEED